MKEWKDELRLESQQPKDSSAINGESADTSEAEYPNVPLDAADSSELGEEVEKSESESHQSENTLKVSEKLITLHEDLHIVYICSKKKKKERKPNLVYFTELMLSWYWAIDIQVAF